MLSKKMFPIAVFFGTFLLFSLPAIGQDCVEGDCKSGYGIIVYDSGTRYEGEFHDGFPFGNGIIYYKDGRVYEGQFDKFPKGKGTYTFADGSIKSGIWDKNVLVRDFQCIKGNCKNGQGTYEYANGDVYEGEFQESKRHGLGIFKMANGDKYVGDFENDAYHGYGTLYKADGTEVTGLWDIGEIFEIADGRNDEQESTEEEVPPPSPHPTYEVVEEEEPEEALVINPNDIKVWAVVVGVSSYPHLQRLNYTDDDAYQVYAFLKSPEGGALPDEQITVLIDERATNEGIKSAMRETFGKARENDVIILYFSGHGLPGAFLPIDTKGRNNRLMHEDILAILDESPASHKLCIADACHSGSLGKRRSLAGKGVDLTIKNYYDAFNNSEGGTALLLSSKTEEISLEANGLRQGIFSHFLIRGLKGEADNNTDTVITVNELFQFISSSVTDYTANYQSPVISGDYDDNMPVGVVRQ